MKITPGSDENIKWHNRSFRTGAYPKLLVRSGLKLNITAPNNHTTRRTWKVLLFERYFIIADILSRKILNPHGNKYEFKNKTFNNETFSKIYPSQNAFILVKINEQPHCGRI